MNITDEGRRKGHEALKRNIAMIPTGGISDPVKATAAFERALKGRCFCPHKGHNANCKATIVDADMAEIAAAKKSTRRRELKRRMLC